MMSLDPWHAIVTDAFGEVVWPRPYYGHPFYREVPSWIHYGDPERDGGTRRVLFDGAFIGAEAPAYRQETTAMARPHTKAGYYMGAEAMPEPRKGLLAEVAPHVAPATGPITVKKEFNDRQVLHVEICVDGKCYRTSMNLGPAIDLVMSRLAQWHKAQHAEADASTSVPAVVGAVEDAIDAAGDGLVASLICRHVNVMMGGSLDDVGSALGATLRELAPVISNVATSVATYYGGAEAGQAAAQLAPVVTQLQANLLDPKGDPRQRAAAQQTLQRVNQVAQTDPRAAQALDAAHRAVRDTTVAYHVKDSVDRALAGDSGARRDVTAVVQAAEKGDPAAKSTYEVIAQALIDKMQNSEWGAQLWERVTRTRSTPVRAGGYSHPVAVGGFWDSLGSGALSAYRTVSTPVTWFNKKVNETIRDNPALKQAVVTAASAIASAYGGPAAGQAAAAFAPSIIDSSAETGGDPTMLFEDTKKKASQASGGDPQVDQAISHAQSAVTQTMAVATLTKIAEDASHGDPEALRQISELRARANAGDAVAIRAMTAITQAQQRTQAQRRAQPQPQRRSQFGVFAR